MIFFVLSRMQPTNLNFHLICGSKFYDHVF
jgi:hypothetical protein